MKNLSFYLFVFVATSILVSCNNQNANQQKQDKAAVVNEPAVIKFDKMEYDFGTLNEGEKASYDFHFTNLGKADLKLTSVGTSCGCTASEYSTDPIKPGETGKIHVTFDSSHKRGMQHKQVTIRANTVPEFTVLDIYAQVLSKEEN